MPLYKNTNQPYFPDPNNVAPRDCLGDYCYPINQGDFIYQQWYQTPCGANEIADPTFADATYGANLITNGTFATDLAGWTAVDWVWNTGQAEGPITDPTNSLTQSVAITGFSYYRVTFDLAGLSPGDSIRLYLGGLSGWLVYSANGSYDDIIRAKNSTTDIVFAAEDTNLANALIDNVTLEEVTFGSWDTNSDWVINITDGIACADALGTGLLEEAVPDYIVVGDYYQLTFTVSNYVAGTVTPYIANMPGTAISANGTYTIYETPTLTGVVSFLPSADFVGCISAPDLRALKNNFPFKIKDADDNLYDISDLAEYYEDKVTIANQIFDRLELPYACYTIEVTDSCLIEGLELIENGTFSAGDTGWTRNFGTSQYNIGAGVAEFIFDPITGGSNIITNGDFSGGGAGWTATDWVIAGGATHTPGNVSPLSRSITLSTPSSIPPLYTWVQLTVSGRTAGSFTVTLSDKTNGSYTTDGTFCFRVIPTIGGVVSFAITPSSAFDGTIDDIVVIETGYNWQPTPILANTPNADIVAGNYSMGFDITAVTSSGYAAAAVGILGMSQSFAPQTTLATHTISIPNYTPGTQTPWIIPYFIEIDAGGGYRNYPGTITVDNITLVRVEPFDATYESECMNYQFSHPNTKLITGWCDQDAFGFDFANTGFLLQMRTEIRTYNATSEKVKNVAQYGTGNAAVTYAAKTKKWQLATAYLSESAHDALSTIIDCDHFTVGTSSADAIEYVADISDYLPEWRGEGDYNLSIIIFTLRLKDGGQLFNRHI